MSFEVSDAYVKKALGKRWRDNKSTLKKNYYKTKTTLDEKLQNVPQGMLRYQWEDAVRFWHSKKGEERSSGQKVRRLQLFEITYKKKDGSAMTLEAGEIMETLKDKKTEYETIASSDSSVHLEDIDNRIITEVLSPKRYGRVQFQGSFISQPNILDLACTNTWLRGVNLKLKFKAAAEREAEAATREAEAAAREAEAAAREAEAVRTNGIGSDDLLERVQKKWLPSPLAIALMLVLEHYKWQQQR
ncbi:hypothetical protein GOBAR_AA26608 [Gossypium barbadense]|uniref:Uncharacterized protein n=1 Tax=Gossypium barbadense TaxID=3634 RepID=A0A2P5WSJ3_GOSBA|nr:hypothetical protein GOBAR_AA26608 [Gossypium barbadense]